MEFYGSCHCHTDRSNFRLRDSINSLDELCWYAADELKHNFIAITDHETVATMLECQDIEKKIREKYPDFKVIRGNEIYLCRDGLSKENYVRGEDKFYHWILLAKDARGHEQIREISTRAWSHCFEQGRMMRVPTYYQDLIDIIGSDSGHVIFSSACLGSKPSQMLLDYAKEPSEEKWNYIKSWITHISDICGAENFFLETQPSKTKEQIAVNKLYKKLSEEIGFPVIITLDAHYLKKEDESIHHAFLTAQDGERETSDFYASTYMMSREEIHEYMDKSIGAETVSLWMNNTKKIYNMCEDYDLTHPLHIPYLPKTVDTITDKEFELFKNKIHRLEYFYLSPHQADRDMAAAIVRKILKDPEQYDNEKTFTMIDECLDAVRLASEKQQTQWSAYLLNMRDYIDVIWEKGNSLVGCSRGSGGGFILLNILGITQINPAREKAPLRAWRFLNPERVSPLDIDTDIEGGKRPQVYKALQDAYGSDRVSKVLTLRTEKSKSAILTACRGLGVDPDEAAYLASFIKADRGIPRSLKQTFYGDEENDIPADKTFQDLMTNKYPKVWQVAQKIENLCCGIGSHAGGVIFYDEPITKTTALMQTTNGDVITQLDLHQAERTGLIKIDLLSIEALDRMRACLDLLVKYHYVKSEGKTLRQIYEDTIGVYNIEREASEMWKMIHQHKVENLFQMEQQSGIKGIALAKPQTVEELASINSVMRLMVSEKGALQPLDIFAMRKKNPALWEAEMINYGLSDKEREWLHSWLDTSYGICETQETLMSMLQDPMIGAHTLLFADRVRKSIAKKKPEEFLKCQKEFYETIEEKKLSKTLAHYTWDIVFAASRGYSFCMAHTLAYSIVGLQEMNLAYKFPIIFWDTANLIVDSGAMNLDQEIRIEDDNEENSDNDNEEQEKIKNSTMDYGKVASAIGKMKSRGLSFSLPNINKSDLTFSPDLESNTILYGLRGITRIGNQLIKEIILNRPYTSIEDFLAKIKINKPQMINLIKSGAFDELYHCSREEVMSIYLNLIADKKKRITLQNMQMLIAKNLIPSEFDFEKRLFNFNKYLKKRKAGDYYSLDVIAATFFNNNYDESLLTDIQVSDDDYSAKISQKTWDNFYKKGMEPIRMWMKDKQEEILTALNNSLLADAAEKYTEGSISKWEMDSLSFYYHDHELQNLRNEVYGIENYFDLPEEPIIANRFPTKDGSTISIFKLSRIAGTVIDKDKNKSTVVLLTPDGVVTVKVWKNQFAKWDKQISERDSEGTKHVRERSWFTRGTKLIITGIRRDDTFIPKKYKNTEYPLFERIDNMDEKGFILSSATERIDEEG